MQGVKTKPRLEPKNHLSHFWHSSNTPFVVGKSGKPYSTVVCMYVHVDIRCMGTVHTERERALPHSLPPLSLLLPQETTRQVAKNTTTPLTLPPSPSLPLLPRKIFYTAFCKEGLLSSTSAHVGDIVTKSSLLSFPCNTC